MFLSRLWGKQGRRKDNNLFRSLEVRRKLIALKKELSENHSPVQILINIDAGSLISRDISNWHRFKNPIYEVAFS